MNKKKIKNKKKKRKSINLKSFKYNQMSRGVSKKDIE